MMDSLRMYQSIIFQEGKFRYVKAGLKEIDELVQCIMNEIMVEPYDMDKSPFIKETVELIKMIRGGKFRGGKAFFSIGPYDVYMVIMALRVKVENDKFTAVTWGENDEFSNNLFKKRKFPGNQLAEMNKVDEWLMEIRYLVEEKRTKELTGIPESLDMDSLSMERTGIGDVRNGFENIRSEQNETQGKMSLGFDKGKSIERSNNCRLNVQDWHRDSQALQDELKKMQPMVSEVLQKMMGFSNNITENYVLQFARMQIDLYNLISDNLSYHANAVFKYNNQDYANAVSNYQEFLNMIVENLSAFGVEEISSGLGTRFDGNIHEVLGDADFSPRMSSVKESVRSGFQYKETVIQKEKIRV